MKPSKIRLTSHQNESFESMNIVQLNSVNCFRKWRVLFVVAREHTVLHQKLLYFWVERKNKTFKTKLGEKKLATRIEKSIHLRTVSRVESSQWKQQLRQMTNFFFRLLRKVATPSKSTADNLHQRIGDLFKL